MKTIGLDIGTTTICATLIDANTGELLEFQTHDNKSNIEDENEIYKMQNPDIILDTILELVTNYKNLNEDIISIGISGQMHGILYLDENGNSVSPLFTWQDKRGDCLYKDELSYAKWIEHKTGYFTATGFGITTHFYNQINNLVPKQAVTFCSIADYIGLKLADIKKPIIHQSIAQSFGVYNLTEKDFDKKALEKINIDYNFLPEVCKNNSILGKTKENISVALGFGDNQASFMGSASTSNCVLVNVGTGSQVSLCTDELNENSDIEYRPYIDNLYLANGSALSGGYSYLLLRKFFEQTLDMFKAEKPENIYDIMNKKAEELYVENNNNLKFDTRFNGTRKQPKIKATINNLSDENFTPAHFTLATLEGMCEELYQLYINFNVKSDENTILIASGNGLRCNPLLREIFSKRFSMDIEMSKYAEEAGYGAGLFSLYSINYYKSLDEIYNLYKS